MAYNRTRRDFLKTAGVAGAAAYTSPFASGAFSFRLSGQRLNIIYLFSDEHRYQSMSFTETPQVQTPHLARMAAGGMQLRQAVSNNPVCVPYRSMLLTGRWCYDTGMLENYGTLGPWQKTIGHVFRDAGYTTGYTGKWHAGNYPHLAGFDWHMHWKNTNNHWDSQWTDLHGTGLEYQCDIYNGEKMTDQALEFINAHAEDAKPMFLMVSWNPPHAIFTDPPEDKKALYPDDSLLPWRANASGINATWWNNYQGYHAHITAIDEQIGRIFGRLEELGLSGNTIVVYSSDHGSMMKSHNSTNKRRPEEESCRVPFLVTGPGIPAGRVRDELFGTIDIFPTLCGLAGIPIPDFCEGSDYSSGLRGGDCPDPSSQLLMHIANQGIVENLSVYHTPFFRGVRGKRFTYTVGIDGPRQLFDNRNDPFQLTNLISSPAHAEVRAVMQAELDQWIQKVEDPHLHEAYHSMPLPDRIYRQALVHGKGVRLKQFLSKLKLSPAQEDQLKPIELEYYGTDNRPLPGFTWAAADAGYRAGLKEILTTEQVAEFERFEEFERIALQG